MAKKISINKNILSSLIKLKRKFDKHAKESAIKFPFLV